MNGIAQPAGVVGAVSAVQPGGSQNVVDAAAQPGGSPLAAGGAASSPQAAALQQQLPQLPTGGPSSGPTTAAGAAPPGGGSGATSAGAHFHLAMNPFPFNPQVLFEGPDSWTDDKVKMLDLLVEIMYTQDISALVAAFSGRENDPALANVPRGEEGRKLMVKAAHDVLDQLKQAPDSWKSVAKILEKSANPQTKFYGLNLLEGMIKKQWRLASIPRNDIRNYISQVVIDISSNPDSLQSGTPMKTYLQKLNETLVHIVKQEWPHEWPSFIPDICMSSRQNQFLCENNLKILACLSEDIFDFGEKHMVSSKVLELKTQLSQQFTQIFELCMWVFQLYLHQQSQSSVPE